jgi:hypothetical protein
MRQIAGAGQGSRYTRRPLRRGARPSWTGGVPVSAPCTRDTARSRSLPQPQNDRARWTVDGDTRKPSRPSSPLIRRCPQRGFSRASRSTRTRMSVAMGGRPRRPARCRHRRRTSARCHRGSVRGVTRRAPCEGRGRWHAAAARPPPETGRPQRAATGPSEVASVVCLDVAPAHNSTRIGGLPQTTTRGQDLLIIPARAQHSGASP